MTQAYQLAPPSPLPYGIDFWIGFAPGPNKNAGNTVLDADPGMRVVTGRALLVQSLLCRQTTPTGSVIDCPNDCFNVIDLLEAGMTPSALLKLYDMIRLELLKDQRVLTAVVTGTFSFQTAVLQLTEAIQSSYGPFSLVLEISQVTAQILNANLVSGTN